MIPLGEIKLNTALFVEREAIEKQFPFHFRDVLYGDQECPETEEYLAVSGCRSLVKCLFAPLIGQIIVLPSGSKVRITEVYINYWQQIGAHGKIIEPPAEDLAQDNPATVRPGEQ